MGSRIRDIVGAAVGLVVASPALAVAAIGIKLEDRGPLLFRQRRVGQDGEEFELLKLRTMVVGAEREGAGYAVDRGDPRITRVGPTELSVDGFFTLNPQPTDLALLPARYRAVVRTSETLRRVSETVKPLTLVADSVYARSRRG